MADKAAPDRGGGHPPVGTVFQDAPFGPELVVVPAGRFMMGSPDDEPERNKAEGPQREVTIARPLAVGRYAVTFAEWDFAQGDAEWRSMLTGPAPREADDRGWGRGDQPVIGVSWEDAQGYAKWLAAKTGRDYRLLSEAEWEYCCRAGSDTPFWWGATVTPSQANYKGYFDTNGEFVYAGSGGEYGGKTFPVRAFAPNPWGLYQMHGNVCEWVRDAWHESHDGAPDDGSARMSVSVCAERCPLDLLPLRQQQPQQDRSQHHGGDRQDDDKQRLSLAGYPCPTGGNSAPNHTSQAVGEQGNHRVGEKNLLIFQ
jgi:formylglycine-generating enzyme required for sulfatase activity